MIYDLYFFYLKLNFYNFYGFKSAKIAFPNRRFSLERQRREDVASALMKLSQIRQHYSDLGRPRFVESPAWFADINR
jgi:hypothetical protein